MTVTPAKPYLDSSYDQLNRMMVELLDSAVFHLDRAGAIATWPQACEDLTGWQRHQVVGLAPQQLLDTSDQDPGAPLEDLCGWMRRSDGRRFVARVAVASTCPLISSDGLQCAVLQDVTARSFSDAQLKLGDASRVLIPFDGDESMLYERVVRVVDEVLSPASTLFVPHRVAPGVRTLELRDHRAKGNSQLPVTTGESAVTAEVLVKDEFETMGVLRVHTPVGVAQFSDVEQEFLTQAGAAIVTGLAAARSIEEIRHSVVAAEQERIARDLQSRAPSL